MDHSLFIVQLLNFIPGIQRYFRLVRIKGIRVRQTNGAQLGKKVFWTEESAAGVGQKVVSHFRPECIRKFFSMVSIQKKT